MTATPDDSHGGERLWELSVKESVKCGEWRFRPPVAILCEKLGIEHPVTLRTLEEGDERFIVLGFEWPEDAAAIHARLLECLNDFAARLLFAADGLPPNADLESLAVQ